MRALHCQKSSQYNAQMYHCNVKNANNPQGYDKGLEKV